MNTFFFKVLLCRTKLNILNWWKEQWDSNNECGIFSSISGWCFLVNIGFFIVCELGKHFQFCPTKLVVLEKGILGANMLAFGWVFFSFLVRWIQKFRKEGTYLDINNIENFLVSGDSSLVIFLAFLVLSGVLGTFFAVILWNLLYEIPQMHKWLGRIKEKNQQYLDDHPEEATKLFKYRLNQSLPKSQATVNKKRL